MESSIDLHYDSNLLWVSHMTFFSAVVRLRVLSFCGGEASVSSTACSVELSNKVYVVLHNVRLLVLSDSVHYEYLRIFQSFLNSTMADKMFGTPVIHMRKILF